MTLAASYLLRRSSRLLKKLQMQAVARTGRGGFETRPYDTYVSTGSAAATQQMDFFSSL